MLTFPTHLFNPSRIVLRPASAVITGGESLSGETDTIRTDGGGYWLISLLGIELLSTDLIRAWRAWEDTLESGVTKVLVPVADVRMAPRPVVGGRLSSPSQLHPQSDDPYFPEAVGFATPWIVAHATADAALRATELSLTVVNGARVKGGEVFAINHPTAGRRIYRVGRVLARAGQDATVQIRPPLREAITDGNALDFDWPSVVATLLPDADISPEILYGRSSVVDILFREAF
jgi:hypothetical protein